MLEHHLFARDRNWAAQLVRDQVWATLVSPPARLGEDGVVSHLPVLVEDTDDDSLSILGHLGNPDQEFHRLGTCRVTLIVPGVHGYVSPAWYRGGPYVPTWNFEVAHFFGTPQVLDGVTTYEVLERTCESMESARDEPWQLDSVREYADTLAQYTTGFRLVPDRVVAKSKLNDDKPVEDIRGVISGLESDSRYHNPALARRMRERHSGVLEVTDDP